MKKTATGEIMPGNSEEKTGKTNENLKKSSKWKSVRSLITFVKKLKEKSGIKHSDTKKNIEMSPGPGTYSINYVEKKRKGGVIGKSKGHDFVTKLSGPGPGAYDSLVKPSTPSWSFKMSEKMVLQNDTPGPGKYEPFKLRSGIAHSTPKAKKNLLFQGNSTPGPGAYSSKGFSSTKYSIGKSKRYMCSNTRTPGPCDYSYSKPSHSPKIKFGKQLRSHHLQINENPSPASYTPKQIKKSRSFTIPKASKTSIFNT